MIMKNIFEKIGTYIKEYAYLIIAILILAFVFRGCSINRLERISEMDKTKFETVIDSLQTNLDNVKDTLYNVRMENDALKNTITEYRKDKDYYIGVNKELINTNKNLSKQPIITKNN